MALSSLLKLLDSVIEWDNVRKLAKYFVIWEQHLKCVIEYVNGFQRCMREIF